MSDRPTEQLGTCEFSVHAKLGLHLCWGGCVNWRPAPATAPPSESWWGTCKQHVGVHLKNSSCEEWTPEPPAPATPEAPPAKGVCLHCGQEISFQARYENWPCCCFGYWFSRTTGSGCPKSEKGHAPRPADSPVGAPREKSGNAPVSRYRPEPVGAPPAGTPPDAVEFEIVQIRDQWFGTFIVAGTHFMTNGFDDPGYAKKQCDKIHDAIVKLCHSCLKLQREAALASPSAPAPAPQAKTRFDVYPWLNELVKKPGWNVGRFVQSIEECGDLELLADVLLAYDAAHAPSAPAGTRHCPHCEAGIKRGKETRTAHFDAENSFVGWCALFLSEADYQRLYVAEAKAAGTQPPKFTLEEVLNMLKYAGEGSGRYVKPDLLANEINRQIARKTEAAGTQEKG